MPVTRTLSFQKQSHISVLEYLAPLQLARFTLLPENWQAVFNTARISTAEYNDQGVPPEHA